METLQTKIDSVKEEIERNNTTISELKEQNKKLQQMLKKMEKIQIQINGIYKIDE